MELKEGCKADEYHECHAGSYETSLVLATEPALVDKEIMKKLEFVQVNLVREIIKKGLKDFKKMGLHQAYCGSPSKASEEKGEELFTVLTNMLVQSIYRLLQGGGRDQEGSYGKV